MKYLIVFYLTTLLFSSSNAQSDSLIFVSKQMFNFSPIKQISLDDREHFLVLNKNHFLKISPSLDTIYSFFHGQQNESVNSFQSYPLQSFLFSKEAQKILILNRFLTKHSDITIPDNLFTFMELACVTNDQYLWIVDMESLRLKKYNYQTNNLVFETSLLSIIENDFTPIQLIFYNNLLFLHHEQGILVFDIFGNFKYNLPIKTNTFSFYQDQIILISDHQIVEYHLFYHTKNQYKIPFPINVLHVLYNGTFFYIFNENYMYKHKKKSP